MKSINSGFSNNATDDVGDVLRRMDPNSKVLAAFNMKKTKAAYIINHGLAPYYRDLLYEQINVTRCCCPLVRRVSQRRHQKGGDGVNGSLLV